MIAWLWNLVIGRICCHVWEIQSHGKLYENGDNKKMPYGTLYVMRCKKCGEIKRRKITV